MSSLQLPNKYRVAVYVSNSLQVLNEQSNLQIHGEQPTTIEQVSQSNFT